MEIYKRSHMIYAYTWSGSASEGHLFDPMNGTEVLSLINKFLATYQLKSIASGCRSEQLLRKRLPSIPHTKEEILHFLQENY